MCPYTPLLVQIIVSSGTSNVREIGLLYTGQPLPDPKTLKVNTLVALTVSVTLACKLKTSEAGFTILVTKLHLSPGHHVLHAAYSLQPPQTSGHPCPIARQSNQRLLRQKCHFCNSI